MNSNDTLSDDNIRHYSSVLSSLWESYIKYLHVGMVGSGFTIVVIFQSTKGVPVYDLSAQVALKAAITLAGFSGISFGICRWLCQVIMERQVYGPSAMAEKYFALSDTRMPNALLYTQATLSKFYNINNTLKFFGSFCLMIAWVLILFLIWGKPNALFATTM
jgi:hypothetical protein